MDTLANEFEVAMAEKMKAACVLMRLDWADIAHEVNTDGSIAFAKRHVLAGQPSALFEALYRDNNLELSVEALVADERWRHLFSTKERSAAARRLDDFGFPWLELPELVEPVGNGYVTLTQAAQWIASQCGRVRFSASDHRHWRPAFETLRNRIVAEEVELTGECAGVRERVPSLLLVDCPLVLPYQTPDRSQLDRNALYLQAFTLDDTDEWNDAFNDRLVSGVSERWTKLMVPCRQIRRYHPATKSLPGRPSTAMPPIKGWLQRLDDDVLLTERTVDIARGALTWFAEDARQPHGVTAPALSTVEKAVVVERKARTAKR